MTGTTYAGVSGTTDARPVVTYFTITSARYFPGAVALINSLRLTGNTGDVVVVDSGLTPWQKERLAGVATIVPLDVPQRVTPAFYKAYMGESLSGDIVVYLDSDMIVTDMLDVAIDPALEGRICAAPDLLPNRFFPEWHELFALSAPLRQRTYVNSGFLVFAPARWPLLLKRWRECCDRVLDLAPPMHSLPLEESLRDPCAFWDQDPLNALLMSEVPSDSLELIDEARVVTIHDMRRVRCVDADTLRCSLAGRDTLILHCMDGPKPWMSNGWMAVADDAYVRLFPRLLFANDVVLRLNRSELPLWLRGGLRTRAVVPALHASMTAARTLSRALPRPVYERTVTPLRARLRGLGRTHP